MSAIGEISKRLPKDHRTALLLNVRCPYNYFYDGYSIRNILAGSFTWSKSREGVSFWSEVSRTTYIQAEHSGEITGLPDIPS